MSVTEELQRYRERNPDGRPDLRRPYTGGAQIRQGDSGGDFPGTQSYRRHHKYREESDHQPGARQYMDLHDFDAHERKVAESAVAYMRRHEEWRDASPRSVTCRGYQEKTAGEYIDEQMAGRTRRRARLVHQAAVKLAKAAGLELSQRKRNHEPSDGPGHHVPDPALDIATAREICERYHNDEDVSQPMLAREYDVGQATIWKVVNGKRPYEDALTNGGGEHG